MFAPPLPSPALDLRLRIADRLGHLAAGSRLADETIHRALGRPGDPPPYTTCEAAARTILPSGYEVAVVDRLAGAVYIGVKRPGGAHSGQRCATAALALCAAALRAQVAFECSGA